MQGIRETEGSKRGPAGYVHKKGGRGSIPGEYKPRFFRLHHMGFFPHSLFVILKAPRRQHKHLCGPDPVLSITTAGAARKAAAAAPKLSQQSLVIRPC